MVTALLGASPTMTGLAVWGLQRALVSGVFAAAKPSTLRNSLPKLSPAKSSSLTNSPLGNGFHTMRPLPILRSRLCPVALGRRTVIGLRPGGCLHLHGRHLSSRDKDGKSDGECSSDEEDNEFRGHDDYNAAAGREARLKSAERLQGVHQLLEDAQVQAPTRDFEFADIPKRVQRRDGNEGEQEPDMDPRDMTIFLFPGQGTQFVGMGRSLLEYPNVREMFFVASDILGYDLLDLCLNGSKEELDKTVHSQPAIMVCSLAAVEKLREEQPKAIENCVSAAGFSVGELSALVFSGAITFEDTMRVIKVRAKAMQDASEQAASGLLSVIGRPGVSFDLMCREAMDSCLLAGVPEPVCKIAAHLFPEAKVVAGHAKALDYIQEMSGHYMLRTARRVPVSGAFHSPLMHPARESFYAAVDAMPAEEPIVPVHANVNGQRFRHGRHIRTLLKRQLLEPVHWQQTIQAMYQRHQGVEFPRTYEVGPGQQLGSYLKRNNLKAFRSYSKIDV